METGATRTNPIVPLQPKDGAPAAPPRGPGHSFQPPGAEVQPQYVSSGPPNGARQVPPPVKSLPPPGLGLGKPDQSRDSPLFWCVFVMTVVLLLAGGGGAAVYFFVIAPSVTDNGVVVTQSAWVNEIDYDQVGSDSDEFVEIAVNNGIVTNASSVDVHVYLGNTQTFSLVTNLGSGLTRNASGSIITTRPVSSAVVIGGITLYVIDYESADLQNGPDGIAVAVDGVLQEFISYEGVFMATDGVAQGVTSFDIGQEDSNVEEGSLQLIGTGSKRSSFVFGLRTAATKGALNTGQLFV